MDDWLGIDERLATSWLAHVLFQSRQEVVVRYELAHAPLSPRSRVFSWAADLGWITLWPLGYNGTTGLFRAELTDLGRGLLPVLAELDGRPDFRQLIAIEIATRSV